MMTRPALRPILLAASLLGAAACGERAQGPATATVPVGLVLAFPGGAPGAHAVFGEAINAVRVYVSRPNEQLVVDTTYDVPTGNGDIKLAVQLPITQRVETLYVNVDLMAGRSSLFSAFAEFVLVEGGIPPVPKLPLQYVGQGWDAVSLTISPRTAFVLPRGSLAFTATVINGQQLVVTPPVAWSVSDRRLATIDEASGLLTASAGTGTLWVRAVTPTGVRDSVQVSIGTQGQLP